MATSTLKSVNDEEKGTLARLTYDGLQFVDVPADCLCTFCGMVPIFNAIFPCGHPYCRGCYKQIVENGLNCRKCKTLAGEKMIENDYLEVKIFELETYCPNKTFGCEDVITLDKLLLHMSECQFKEVSEQQEGQHLDKVSDEIHSIKDTMEAMKIAFEDCTNGTKAQLTNIAIEMDSKFAAITERLDDFDQDKNWMVDILKEIKVGVADLVVQKMGEVDYAYPVVPRLKDDVAVKADDLNVLDITTNDPPLPAERRYTYLHCACGYFEKKELNLGFHLAAKCRCVCCNKYVCVQCQYICSSCLGLACAECRITFAPNYYEKDKNCHLCAERMSAVKVPTDRSGLKTLLVKLHQKPESMNGNVGELTRNRLRLCRLWDTEKEWDDLFGKDRDYAMWEFSVMDLKLLAWNHRGCIVYDDCVSKEELFELVTNFIRAQGGLEGYLEIAIENASAFQLRVKLDKYVSEIAEKAKLLKSIQLLEVRSGLVLENRGLPFPYVDDVANLSSYDLRDILRYFRVSLKDVMTRVELVKLFDETRRNYDSLPLPWELCESGYGDQLNDWTLRSSLSKNVRACTTKEELLFLAGKFF